MEVRLTAPLSARMIELAALAPGQRVLDLATGRGEPAIAAARVVAPHGEVIGVDPAASMLAMARQRADREGLANLALRCLDAAALDELPTASFDAVLCRWGLQYMARPAEALAGARRCLRDHGRLVVAVWCEPERVPYSSWARRLLELERPLPPVELDRPGTFYYADPSRLVRDLEGAGFDLLGSEEVEVPVMEAATVPELVAWLRAFGMARLFNELAISDEAQRSWEAAVAAHSDELLEGGRYRLGGVTRLVVATPRRAR